MESRIRRRDIATLVARLHGVTPNYVRKVINGKRENEDILMTYFNIHEADNLLLQAVKESVPFNPKSKAKS